MGRRGSYRLLASIDCNLQEERNDYTHSHIKTADFQVSAKLSKKRSTCLLTVVSTNRGTEVKYAYSLKSGLSISCKGKVVLTYRTLSYNRAIW